MLGIIERVKVRQGITDDLQDELLQDLYCTAVEEYKVISGNEELLEKHKWIIKEIINIRYNRVGNEGYKSTSEEGLSITYSNDREDDWSKYFKYLQSDENSLVGAKRGKVKFL